MGTPRINLVTLGVRDIGKARAFYEALGLTPSPASQDGVAFYEVGGVVLSLFGRADLAADAGVADAPTGFAAVALAWNVESEAAVDAAVARAADSGARIEQPPRKVFWGGYCGYFSDPDGHFWEVAYNPFFPLDAEGRLRLPDNAANSEAPKQP